MHTVMAASENLQGIVFLSITNHEKGVAVSRFDTTQPCRD